MVRLSLVLIIAVCVTSTAAQLKSDRDKANLRGPVQTIRTNIWHYGGPDSRQKPDSGDMVTFDKVGNEIERIMVSDFGEAIGKQTQVFDANGILLESKWVNPRGSLQERQTFRHSDGKLVETRSYDGKGVLREKSTRSYDTKGNMSEEVYYDPIKAVAKTIFTYNSAGDATQMAFFLSDGKKATAPIGPCLGAHRVVFSYDSSHRPITKAAYETDGLEKKNWVFAYDDHGNYTNYTIKSSFATTKISYSYVFDSRSNWVKSTSISQTDDEAFDVLSEVTEKRPASEKKKEEEEMTKTTRVMTREITYFP
ncbi:MAG: hypothetical protein WBO10_16300 [Pyrinomonadaceae bacterium]